MPIFDEFDDEHSDDENRYRAIGLLPNLTCIVVIYTIRGKKIRIISARKAEADERERYHAHKNQD